MTSQLSSREARVEDYLNDKLQTAADLENLDSLLVDVKKQQGLLRQQVILELLHLPQAVTDREFNSLMKPNVTL